jgi:hypothetical protein
MKDAIGIVTTAEAHEILQRFINSHFHPINKGDAARFSIPVNPKRDDDVRMTRFIQQQEEKDAELAALRKENEEIKQTIKNVRALTFLYDPDEDGSKPLVDQCYIMNGIINKIIEETSEVSPSIKAP